MKLYVDHQHEHQRTVIGTNVDGFGDIVFDHTTRRLKIPTPNIALDITRARQYASFVLFAAAVLEEFNKTY